MPTLTDTTTDEAIIARREAANLARAESWLRHLTVQATNREAPRRRRQQQKVPRMATAEAIVLPAPVAPGQPPVVSVPVTSPVPVIDEKAAFRERQRMRSWTFRL